MFFNGHILTHETEGLKMAYIAEIMNTNKPAFKPEPPETVTWYNGKVSALRFSPDILFIDRADLPDSDNIPVTDNKNYCYIRDIRAEYENEETDFYIYKRI